MAARKGVGVPELLEIFANMMPNPTEANRNEFERHIDGCREPVEVTPDGSKPIVAYVFKVTADPFIGKLGIFRIFQGTVRKDSQLHVADEKKTFKVGHLLTLQEKSTLRSMKEFQEIFVRWRRSTRSDSTPCSVTRLLMVTCASTYDFPQPMNGFAIEAKSRGDEQKIGKALSSMEAEDPCFAVERNSTTHETVITVSAICICA